jgi:protein ImuA
MRRTPDVLQDLAARIRAIETAAQPPGPVAGAVRLPFLDLPLAAGALVELLGETDGAGAWTLGLYWARHACAEGRTLVLVDARGWFYPPAAAALGVDLEHVLLVRPTSWPDCCAALDQALRCAAVGAVVGWCERLRAAEAQRLRLAAEAGGGLGLILRPLGAARGPSFADLRLRISPSLSTDVMRRVRIEVLRWRGRGCGGKEGQALIVEIDDETGHVRVPAGLAPAAARA